MLQKLNEKTQGVVAWVIIIIIALTFMLFGLDYYIQAKGNHSVKTVVNGKKISQQAFDLVYRRLKQQQPVEQLTPMLESQLKQQALKQMIVNTVSRQNALLDGFFISTDQAKQAIQQIPQFQQDGQFSVELYQQVLNSAYFTADSFLDEVKQGMLLNQQRFSYVGTAFSLPNEVKRFVALVNQSRNYDYLTLSAPQFYASSKPTEKQMQDYYQAKQSSFMTPEKISLQYVELSMPTIRDSIKVSDVDVSQFYQDNIDSYRQPAKWRIAHVLIALPENADETKQKEALAKADKLAKELKQKPEQFSDFVKKYSDDKLSLLSDGELPWISASAEPGPLELALASLTKVGDISQPIKTKYGYEIVKVKGYKPTVVTPFSKVKETIEKQLVNDKAQQKYADIGDQLTDLSYQTPDSLADVSEQLNLPIKTTELFTRLGEKKALLANKKVLALAFSDEVLAQGNNSEPVQINDDTVVVLRVKQHIAAKAKPFKEVASLIKQQLIKQDAAKKAKDLGEKLLSLQTNAKEFEALLKKYNLSWNNITKATRTGANKSPVINRLAFSMPNSDKPSAWKGESLSNGDFVIVALKSVADGKVSDVNKEQLNVMIQQMEMNNGLRDYDLMINTLVDKAKITS